MAFETPVDDRRSAVYRLSISYVGDPEYIGQLPININTTIGDLMPTAQQEAAFDALVALIAASSDFELQYAARDWAIAQIYTLPE